MEDNPTDETLLKSFNQLLTQVHCVTDDLCDWYNVLDERIKVLENIRLPARLSATDINNRVESLERVVAKLSKEDDLDMDNFKLGGTA